ncbi:MAG: hypothetical protein IT317_07805 [Anaerolineales bacterium]|nr:hypothetical protein [Anaerolineales bacterium]
MPRSSSPFVFPAVALLLCGLAAFTAHGAVHARVFSHLNSGAWIAAHGQAPAADVFTHDFAGQAWRSPGWLSEIGLYIVYERWGAAGLNGLPVVSALAAFTLVYAATSGPVYVRVGAVLLGAAATALTASAWPGLASLVLGAAFVLVLQRWRERGGRGAWALPVLMALWANCDVGFTLGFALLGATLAGEALRALLGQQTWRAVGTLALVGGVCAAAAFLNPYGPGVWHEALSALTPSALRDRLAEWQSPNFHAREMQLLIGLWLATLAVVGLGGQPLPVTDWLLLGGALYLTLVARQNVLLLALVTPPVLSRHGAAALAAWWSGRQPWLARGRGAFARLRPLAPAAAWLAVLVTAGVAAVRLARALDPAAANDAATRGLPVAAADYLAEAHLPGPLYNSHEWGGYLAWRLAPAQQIFVDDRAALYPPAFVADYLKLAGGGPEWADVLEQYDLRVVVAPTGTALAELAQAAPGWTLRHADDLAVVVARD